MPDGLKNLGASSFHHFWKGERLRGTGASEKCIVTKNAQQISKIETLFVPNPAHLQWAQDQGVGKAFAAVDRVSRPLEVEASLPLKLPFIT